MDKSTKEQFYEFVDKILDEVSLPVLSGKQSVVTPAGHIKAVPAQLLEYDENMQLRVVLAIVSNLTKEGKIQELYWLLRNKYLDNLE